MINELANLLDNFPGAANQTRCFTHILNLVVKSILAQFELPKSRANIGDDLLKLAEGIELEEEITAKDSEEGEEGEDDNVEGWIDEREEMGERQLEELEARIEPIRLLLIKVSAIMWQDPNGNALCFSFENRHSESRTPPPLSFQNGGLFSATYNLTPG